MDVQFKREPVCKLLNEAVNVFATKTFPFGIDIRRNAPNTLQEVRDALEYEGRMAIWEGDYGSGSCFADLETWRAFRAWHDSIHVRYDLEFDPHGEWGTAVIQTCLILRVFGRSDEAKTAAAVMWAEQIDPLERVWAQKPAIPDMHDHTAKAFTRYLPLVQLIADQNCWTDAMCIKLAHRIGRARSALGKV